MIRRCDDCISAIPEQGMQLGVAVIYCGTHRNFRMANEGWSCPDWIRGKDLQIRPSLFARAAADYHRNHPSAKVAVSSTTATKSQK